MKILHILNDGPSDLPGIMIREHQKSHEVKVIDLSAANVSYEEIVDDIFSFDRVISW